MIDNVFIYITSGNGGDGAVSGRREKFVPRGGPDGGDGGRGGSVIVECDPNINTLLAFRYKRRFAADNGGNGAGALKHGRDGDDVRISVPVGTQIWNADSNPPQLLADLAAEWQRVTLARGGRGGRGNAYFASPTNQFPLLAEQGEPGESLRLRLELKLLADIGIIGLPNAGKSSLLSVVSAARPKVAAYPFTTLEPALGVVEHRLQTFVMVDIPGLIEGAHEGVGLGHDFLRHIERTRALVHMVDGSTEDPIDDYRKINAELTQFNADLAAKPQIVAVNKTDITEVRQRQPELKAAFAADGIEVLFVSAVTHDGVDALLDKALIALSEADDAASPSPNAPSPNARNAPSGNAPNVSNHDGVDALLDKALIALSEADDAASPSPNAPSPNARNAPSGNAPNVSNKDAPNAAASDVSTASAVPAVSDMPDDALPVLRPKPRRERPVVRKRNGAFIVQAQRAVRIAALLDESDWNARVQFLGYLQRAGIVRALEDAGAAPGDTVRFGDVEWEWQ